MLYIVLRYVSTVTNNVWVRIWKHAVTIHFRWLIIDERQGKTTSVTQNSDGCYNDLLGQ